VIREVVTSVRTTCRAVGAFRPFAAGRAETPPEAPRSVSVQANPLAPRSRNGAAEPVRIRVGSHGQIGLRRFAFLRDQFHGRGSSGLGKWSFTLGNGRRRGLLRHKLTRAKPASARQDHIVIPVRGRGVHDVACRAHPSAGRGPSRATDRRRPRPGDRREQSLRAACSKDRSDLLHAAYRS